MLRFEALLASTSSAINLFRLLEARPALFGRLLAILTLAPTLAEELGRRPELLDTLIDHSALDLPGSVEDLSARMRGIGAEPDYDYRLDRKSVVWGKVVSDR